MSCLGFRLADFFIGFLGLVFVLVGIELEPDFKWQFIVHVGKLSKSIAQYFDKLTATYETQGNLGNCKAEHHSTF